MIPSVTSEMNNFFESQNPTIFPADFRNPQALQFGRFLTNLQNCHSSVPVHDFTPNSSYISSNSTSDEVDDNQVDIIDERKKRRMISNRESARRSRMRKQRQVDELWSQILLLRTENQNLVEKLNHASESHDRVVQENARLKEEASDLRQMMIDLKIGDSYTLFSDFLENIPCNTAHLMAESSNLSITTATSLLH
ncbi:basic leucine zipper 43-like [Olea europaea var. sylvestris]|uniref:basic leucine zipper 43-like n=1 Tax=Olea europaea var. sylvestris TaxID=158386 RepID=UPI000C1D6FFA|nr:basic leucine zipper 43-like [Olea europaea var. sylvestris]